MQAAVEVLRGAGLSERKALYLKEKPCTNLLNLNSSSNKQGNSHSNHQVDR
jgi:hypothetical protein